jgi:hypothetical protein
MNRVLIMKAVVIAATVAVFGCWAASNTVDPKIGYIVALFGIIFSVYATIAYKHGQPLKGNSKLGGMLALLTPISAVVIASVWFNNLFLDPKFKLQGEALMAGFAVWCVLTWIGFTIIIYIMGDPIPTDYSALRHDLITRTKNQPRRRVAWDLFRVDREEVE